MFVLMISMMMVVVFIMCVGGVVMVLWEDVGLFWFILGG